MWSMMGVDLNQVPAEGEDSRDESSDDSYLFDSEDEQIDSNTNEIEEEDIFERIHSLVKGFGFGIDEVLDTLAIVDTPSRTSIKAKYKVWSDEQEEEEDPSNRRKWTEEDINSMVDKGVKDQMELKEVLQRIETEMQRLSSLDVSFIEIRYIQSVLDNWMSDSLDLMKKFIQNGDLSTTFLLWNNDSDFWTEMSQRSSYGLLISKQKRLFQARSEEFLQEFRVRSRELLLTKFQSDKDNCDGNINFFAALIDLLRTINLHYNKEDILSGDGFDLNDEESIRNGFKQLAMNCTAHHDIPKKLTDRFLTALNSFQMTPDTEIMLKNLYSALSNPKVAVNEEICDGRLIIKVQGASVVMSRIIDKLQCKMRRNQVEEVHIHGLNIIHVDVDLPNDKWHGINLVVVTDKICVRNKVTWDVSGAIGEQKWKSSAQCGSEPGSDGQPGEHGLPGESGGNIHIICNEATNASEWMLLSNGGNGGPGQSGGNGVDGTNGKNAVKITKAQFAEKFPSMSYLIGMYSREGKRKVKATLNELLVSRDVDWGDTGSFFVDGKTATGCRIIVSYYQTITIIRNWRHSLYLYQGANGTAGTPGGRGGAGGDGGSGGFHGSVKFTKPDGTKIDFGTGLQLIGDRASDGSKGTAGHGGKHGKHGKAAGDVGFKGWLHTDDGGRFLGFNEDVNYELRYSDAEFGVEPLWCAYKEKWANICQRTVAQHDIIQETRREKVTSGRKQKTESVKKKAVLQSTISQYVKQVSQHAQQQNVACQSLTQQLNATASSLNEALTEKSINQEMTSKLATVKQQMVHNRCHSSDKMRQHFSLNKKRSSLKSHSTSIDRSEVMRRFSCIKCDSFPGGVKMDKLNPVKLDPEELSQCLDLKATRIDADNILHCIYGAEDEFGLFVCSDPAQHRKDIADWLKNMISDGVIRTNETLAKVLQLATKRFVLKNREVENCKLAKDLKRDFDQFKKQTVDDVELLETEISNPENEELANFFKSTNKEDKLLADWIKENKDEVMNLCGLETKFIVGRLSAEFDWSAKIPSNDELLLEYVKFIEAPTETLGLAEMELLAYATDRKIHLFEEKAEESSSFEWIDTLNDSGKGEEFHILLDEGSCHLLKLNQQGVVFRENRKKLAAHYRKNHMEMIEFAKEGSFKDLVSLFSKPEDFHFIDLLNRLDPEITNLPEIPEVLLKRFKEDGVMLEREDLCFLFESIIDWIIEDEDPIIFLQIFVNFCQHQWKAEVILLEIEDHLEAVITHEPKWRNYLHPIESKVLNLMQLSLKRTELISKEKLEEILDMLSSGLQFTTEGLERLEQLSLNDWLFELKSKIWEQKVSGIKSLTTEDQRKEMVYAFLELENKRGAESCSILYKKIQNTKALKWEIILKELDKALMADDDPSTEERTCKEIALLIRNDSNTTAEIKDVICDIAGSVIVFKTGSSLISSAKEMFKASSGISKMVSAWKSSTSLGKSSAAPPKTLDDVKKWAKETNLVLPEQAPTFLAMFDYAVEMVYGFRLRDTQRMAIVTMLTRKNTTFAQVSTGEGKSLIVAGLSIARTLMGLKVDVITSNSCLAIRDSTPSETEGKKGVYDIYEAFGVTIGHNCGEDEDSRIKSYNNQVVYGELSNFQRDYLLHTFYGRNIRGDRNFDCIVVDEVDCMLLDRGINTLYLSHDIPGMDALESVYVYIWKQVCTSASTLEEIRSSVFYDLYGEIPKEDLTSIETGLSLVDLNALWASLIQRKLIDKKGRLLVETVEQMKKKIEELKIKESFKPKLVYYFNNILQRPRQIKVPKHLLPFVDQHINTWLSNALQAIYLKPGEHYVVDQDRSRTSPDLSPQVTIIDPDTGTDQSQSQWDGAMHQFLQLKEGCQISLQSLKAVFVSNISYIRLYRRLAGLTGTLGSGPERSFLQRMYKAEYFTVPTALRKKFRVRPARVLTNTEDWLKSVSEEVKNVIMEEQRSVLVFCQSINQVNVVHQLLQKDLPDLAKKGQLHRYIRDYEDFGFEKTELEPGNVIVATNLAGRGTDIQVSDQLSANGGLHICLTYLPENVRIEEQAFGRSGRKGGNGTGVLIICHPARSELQWPGSKVFELKEERNRTELMRISKLEEDFSKSIAIQEKCFDLFKHRFQSLKKECDESRLNKEIGDILGQCALDAWAFWLDSVESSQYLSKMSSSTILNRLKIELISKMKVLTSRIHWDSPVDIVAKTTDILVLTGFADAVLPTHAEFDADDFDSLLTWLKTPARLVSLGKHLAQYKRYDDAERLFDHLIRQDEYFYPAARYYKTLIHVNRSKLSSESDKIKFKKELWAVEKNILEHSRVQSSYAAMISKVAKESSQQESVCAVEGYEKQKNNFVHLMEQYVSNVRYLLGGYVSTAGLVEAGIDEAQSEKVFQQLLDLGYVSYCFVEDDYKPSVLEREFPIALKKICDEYGLGSDAVKVFLREVAKDDQVNEMKMREILKGCEFFQTRKLFWNYLKECKALERVKDCVIMSTTDCPLDVNKQIRLDDWREGSNGILFVPCIDQKYIEKEGRIVFSKEDVKNHFGADVYKSKKKEFQFNKIAEINMERLKAVKMESFGKMTKENLAEAKIDSSKWPDIWAELIKQNIVKTDGSLGDICATSFTYPNCPAYEFSIQLTIQRIFAFERVQRLLLQDKMNAIDELPLDPDSCFLADLFASHIIAGHRVQPLPVKPMTTEVVDAFKVMGESVPYVQALLAIKYKEEEGQVSKEEGEIDYKEKAKRVASYLLSNQSAFANLETPSASFKPLTDSIVAVAGLENIITEVYVLTINGFDHTIELDEAKWTMRMIGRAVLVVAFGVAQIVFSFYLQMQSFGLATHLASGFMSEGISDVLFGLSALWTGKNFTWADYRAHKLQSIKMTVLTVGVSAFFSRGFPAKTFGEKLRSVGLVKDKAIDQLSQSQLLLKIVKYNGTQIASRIGHGLVSQGVEQGVQYYLRDYCHSLGKQMVGDVHKSVDNKHLDETLGKLYRLKGSAEANRVVNSKMQNILNDSGKWMSVISKYAGAFGIGLGQAMSHRKAADSSWDTAAKYIGVVSSILTKLITAERMREQLVSITSSSLNQLKKDLDEMLQNATAKVQYQNTTDEKEEQFKERAVDCIKQSLETKAEQLVMELTTMLLDKFAHFAAGQAVKLAKGLYRGYKERQYAKRFKKLKKKERRMKRRARKDRKAGKEHNDKWPSKKFVKSSLKLMKKTRSPKLFAAIVKSGVPMDRFCADALAAVLPAMLKKQNPDLDIKKVKIRIETSDGEMVHQTGPQNQKTGPDTITVTITLDRADGNKLGHYQSSVEGSGNNNCMLDAVSEQLKEKTGVDLNSKEMRAATADTIVKDPYVRYIIQQGWHAETMDRGFYGGAKQKKNSGAGTGEKEPLKEATKEEWNNENVRCELDFDGAKRLVDTTENRSKNPNGIATGHKYGNREISNSKLIDACDKALNTWVGKGTDGEAFTAGAGNLHDQKNYSPNDKVLCRIDMQKEDTPQMKEGTLRKTVNYQLQINDVTRGGNNASTSVAEVHVEVGVQLKRAEIAKAFELSRKTHKAVWLWGKKPQEQQPGSTNKPADQPYPKNKPTNKPNKKSK